MKPTIQIKPDGPPREIFVIVMLACRELLRVGECNRHAAVEMWGRTKKCHSYKEALSVIQEYVKIEWIKEKGGVPM